MRSFSAGRGTGDDPTNYRDLVKRVARYAREQLAGMTLVNWPTQLAITLNLDALKAARAPGAPAELLGLMPELPQLLAHARYLRTTADPRRRPDVRRLHL